LTWCNDTSEECFVVSEITLSPRLLVESAVFFVEWYCFESVIYLWMNRAYEYLARAADLGHVPSQERVAFVLLYGNHLRQDVAAAKAVFEKLAMVGSPRGQLVLISVACYYPQSHTYQAVADFVLVRRFVIYCFCLFLF